MRKLFTILVVAFLLFSSCDKKEIVNTNQRNQLQQAEVQSIQPEEPFQRLRNEPHYENTEEYIYMQIKLHYTYYYYTPKGKAEPIANREKNYEELISTVKSRYSLTDSQVDMIRNKRLYIGMHRTCIYLAWGSYQDPLGLSPEEVKTVTANETRHTITYKVSHGKYKTAYTVNDVLVSYQE